MSENYEVSGNMRFKFSAQVIFKKDNGLWKVEKNSLPDRKDIEIGLKVSSEIMNNYLCSSYRVLVLDFDNCILAKNYVFDGEYMKGVFKGKMAYDYESQGLGVDEGKVGGDITRSNIVTGEGENYFQKIYDEYIKDLLYKEEGEIND